jgi:hypothetical protein
MAAVHQSNHHNLSSSSLQHLFQSPTNQNLANHNPMMIQALQAVKHNKLVKSSPVFNNYKLKLFIVLSLLPQQCAAPGSSSSSSQAPLQGNTTLSAIQLIEALLLNK